MDALVYTSRFSVKGHDVNQNKFLTIPALLRNLQEASLQHARQLNTSVWDMTDDKVTWVLIRKELKIIDPLILDGTYTILTYPSGFDKFFAYRDYLIFDQNKKLVVGASSVWTLLQTEERKLVKIPQKIMDIGVPENTRFLTKPEKNILVPSNFLKADTRKVRPYDLDWNNHVNNIVLIRFIMESLKSKGIEDEQISKILVQFKNELKLDETVEIMQASDNNQYFTVLNATKTGKEIVQSKIELN
ncbi:MAG: thioesterase [Saprospiraceae bacterium]|nr:thioesterase [Saprospiraceae bacterium]